MPKNLFIPMSLKSRPVAKRDDYLNKRTELPKAVPLKSLPPALGTKIVFVLNRGSGQGERIGRILEHVETKGVVKHVKVEIVNRQAGDPTTMDVPTCDIYCGAI